MKKFALLTTLISVGAVAAPGLTPNQYLCEGNDKTSVSYSTTSFIGKPMMSVTFKGEEAKLQALPEIKYQKTVLGDLVTVTDNHMVPVDGPTVHYTLVLPQVVLGGNHSKDEFDTVVFRTAVANPFFRPTPFTGYVQHNQAVEVHCTAEHVVF